MKHLLGRFSTPAKRRLNNNEHLTKRSLAMQLLFPACTHACINVRTHALTKHTCRDLAN